MQQFGPALELPWTKLVAPQLTDALIDRVVDGTREQQGTRSIKELERYRDECTEVLDAIATVKARYGMRFED
jgi:carnitine 3-dehydrogenase